MRKLLVLMVALCAAAGAGCCSNNDPCGDSSSRMGNLFGRREQAHHGACCESGPSLGVPVMQQSVMQPVMQQPCCGN